MVLQGRTGGPQPSHGRCKQSSTRAGSGKGKDVDDARTLNTGARTHRIRVVGARSGVVARVVHLVGPEERLSAEHGRPRGVRVAVQIAFVVPPVLVVPHAEQHDEVLDQRQEHEQRARDQPHFDALQFQRARRVVPAQCPRGRCD